MKVVKELCIDDVKESELAKTIEKLIRCDYTVTDIESDTDSKRFWIRGRKIVKPPSQWF